MKKPCKEWTGATAGEAGYGVIYGGHRMISVHRLSYMLHHNVVLGPGKVVMHLCNNPACYEPTHLRLGTQSENMRHWLATNGAGAHRLTEQQVAQIKRRLLDGEKQRDLAAEFGCSPVNISNINTGRSWSWVEPTN